ncbi:prepilin-type N-terminal cleavage/methylation domain-containing protein [Candidatus Saccharibacteria bacterium]|nr:prepilin-type N-terminal cleavage/methylation domain-containing protein [Candidatus Saccharibacteria bacterium]
MKRVPEVKDNMRNHKKGFTIIEVLMFLAITALLVSGMFIGTGANLARERYNDGVAGIEEFLAHQFMLVQNPERPVNNVNATNDLACVARTTGGTALPMSSVNTSNIHTIGHIGVIPAVNLPPNATAEHRGRSDCLIYGRIIEFFTVNGEQHITATPIVGRDLEAFAIANNDVDFRANLLQWTDLELLEQTRIGRADDTRNCFVDGHFQSELCPNTAHFVPNWGTTLAGFTRTPGTGDDVQYRDNIQDPAQGAILILRMPVSGSIRTFITTGGDSRNSQDLGVPGSPFIDLANSTQSRFFCVIPDGSGIWTPTLRVIRVQQNVGNITAVTTLPTDFTADDEGVLIQCRQ